jgi:hypothetical protein
MPISTALFDERPEALPFVLSDPHPIRYVVHRVSGEIIITLEVFCGKYFAAHWLLNETTGHNDFVIFPDGQIDPQEWEWYRITCKQAESPLFDFTMVRKFQMGEALSDMPGMRIYHNSAIEEEALESERLVNDPGDEVGNLEQLGLISGDQIENVGPQHLEDEKLFAMSTRALNVHVYTGGGSYVFVSTFYDPRMTGDEDFFRMEYQIFGSPMTFSLSPNGPALPNNSQIHFDRLYLRHDSAGTVGGLVIVKRPRRPSGAASLNAPGTVIRLPHGEATPDSVKIAILPSGNDFDNGGLANVEPQQRTRLESSPLDSSKESGTYA